LRPSTRDVAAPATDPTVPSTINSAAPPAQTLRRCRRRLSRDCLEPSATTASIPLPVSLIYITSASRRGPRRSFWTLRVWILLPTRRQYEWRRPTPTSRDARSTRRSVTADPGVPAVDPRPFAPYYRGSPSGSRAQPIVIMVQGCNHHVRPNYSYPYEPANLRLGYYRLLRPRRTRRQLHQQQV
jgi:hypothetical protein